MNPEGYVSYPLALALKKAGFDERCRHHYDIEDAPEGCYWEGSSWHKKNHNEDILKFSAPSLWQAQKWLREKKKIDIELRVWLVGDTREYRPYIMPPKKHDFIAYPPEKSYEQALSAGIEAALELIDNEKE